MKTRYTTPEAELLNLQLSACLLEDSFVENYEGEDAIPGDGTW